MREKIFNILGPVPQATASVLDTTYALSRRLELDLNERRLSVLELDQRLIRSKIYEASQSLNAPTASRLALLPSPIAYLFHAFGIRSPQVDQKMRQLYESSLDDTIAATNRLIDTHFLSPDARRRARTIELAINDFFATASDTNLGRPPMLPRASLRASLEDWQAKWREELT